MKLPITYICPAGNCLTIQIDALNDAPDTIKQPCNLFLKCWSCENPSFEPQIQGSEIKTVGYCVLEASL